MKVFKKLMSLKNINSGSHILLHTIVESRKHKGNVPSMYLSINISTPSFLPLEEVQSVHQIHAYQ